ncbi:MAG: ABC transporter ATP-binding protein, partial [Sphaerochaetaceae bacterium]|nr:ABC transporter ATP-binding protein [Sphaerochaetaceae bacterium]
MEVLIPTLMARIIDNGVYAGDMAYVEKMSVYIVLSALCSLAFGVLGSFTAAKASTGFAKNLRHDIFNRIESFSFKSIDTFSTSSLITRITTDVQNVQNSMQMLIRICFRAPIMFIIAIIMVFRNGGSLVLIFACAIPILALFIYNNMTSVHPIFTRVFKHYDRLNRTVEENITGIRTVKAKVREDYEIEKFDAVSQSIHDDFVSAQKKIAIMHPFMTFMTYTCMLLIAWFGAHLILDGKLGTGELMSVFTYTMMILMNLMMIAFIILSVTMSRASGQRIVEVLRAESEMDENANGLKEVPDGSVKFDHVYFSYGGDATVLHDINLDIKSG